MSSKQSTIDYLIDQISTAGIIRYRKMFGDYAIYCNDKVVGFVCDDQLFIKPTDAGNEYISQTQLAPPYPGAKLYYLIDGDLWEDAGWISELIIKTAEELPQPKVKTKASKR